MPRGEHLRPPLPDGWVGLPEAAKALGIEPASLWKGVRKGEITAYREFEWNGRVFYGFKKEDLGII